MPFPFRSNIRDGDIKTGDVVCDYLRPFPPRGTGWHRYVFLLFKQKANLDFPNVSCSTERYLHGSDYACISRHTRTKHWSYLHQRVILVTVFVCKRGPLKRKIFTSSIRMISHRLAWHSFRLNGSLASKTPSIISLVGGAGHTPTHVICVYRSCFERCMQFFIPCIVQTPALYFNRSVCCSMIVYVKTWWRLDGSPQPVSDMCVPACGLLFPRQAVCRSCTHHLLDSFARYARTKLWICISATVQESSAIISRKWAFWQVIWALPCLAFMQHIACRS